ncbi:uncharacterized protein TNCV_1560321 [Trichonephila clavipes]|nr:uncharacterized protein TNCV_1560321 [Trichonephila clavipes]
MENYAKCPFFPKPHKGITTNTDNYSIVVNNLIRLNVSYAQATLENQESSNTISTQQMAPRSTKNSVADALLCINEIVFPNRIDFEEMAREQLGDVNKKSVIVVDRLKPTYMDIKDSAPAQNLLVAKDQPKKNSLELEVPTKKKPKNFTSYLSVFRCAEKSLNTTLARFTALDGISFNAISSSSDLRVQKYNNGGEIDFTESDSCLEEDAFDNEGLFDISQSHGRNEITAGPLINISRNISTVHDCLKHWSNNGTVSKRSDSGRPRATTEREDRRIRRTTLAHRTASAAEIRAAIGTTVTQRTQSKFCLDATDDHVLVRWPGKLLQPDSLRSRHTGPTPGVMLGRALDWFEVLGYKVVEDKATDYGHLKQALSEQFPVVRNWSELETRFYSSSQKHNQKPFDFVYDLLMIHKILKLEMTEEKFIDHVISRLEPQILDYVEVRHTQTTSTLLQIIDKYEERFLNRKIKGSSWEFRGTNPSENNRFPNRNLPENWKETRALWDTGAEKSCISEEVYYKYFSYRPRQKTKDRVVTAQGTPCCHLGWVELQIRIREFQKTWEFHIFNNMQYQCILGIDFMKESKLTLDFDQKSLIIPDNQIKQLPKVEKPVDIDLSDTKLGEGQNLTDLFNGFKGLFSDQPRLTHVLYHEIDTGDKGPVVSRPYRYDRVKQGIINYHIEKMLQEGSIRPIRSPYMSPVVLTRKNNGLPPDTPEMY